MSSGQDQQEPAEDLEAVLLKNSALSPAQLDLAKRDCDAFGMSLEEVLLARRWIDEESLYNLAPWLKKQAPSASNYQKNLESYKQVLKELIGELAASLIRSSYCCEPVSVAEPDCEPTSCQGPV